MAVYGALATVAAVTAPCQESRVLSKVIIEAALLSDDEKIAASRLAKAAGADYVKTSTGFGPGGATTADVALMRRAVGAEMGIKAAGGVRDLAGVKAMIESYPLARAAEAYARMLSGKARFRVVITMT